jgi:uncharacterized YigZ family protein
MNMTKPYSIPAQRTRTETEVQKSRFIATISPAFSVEEARAFIAEIKSEFSDASHNVPAFVIGYGASLTAHCHDDGEPSGTAGRPALAVLQGSGLGDAAVVVTRFFGGTKLGTGGLVRAYGDAVKAVLEITPLAQRVQVHMVMLALPYPLFERVRLLIESHAGGIMEQDFAADVTLTVRFRVEDLPAFQGTLSELTRGELQAKVIEAAEMIVPIKSASSIYAQRQDIKRNRYDK